MLERPWQRSCRFLFCLAMLLSIFSLAAFAAGTDNADRGTAKKLWQPISQSEVPARGLRSLFPDRSAAFRLNEAALLKVLRDLPTEFSSEAESRLVIIEIPMPDGTLAHFRVEDSPVLASHLSSAFPSWRTVQGYGIEDPTATARFDWSIKGFHGFVITEKGVVYIDPMQDNDTANYLVYYKHEYGRSGAGPFVCKFDGELADSLNIERLRSAVGADAPAFANGSAIRTYRLAIATTGEWARGTTTSTDPITIRTAALAAMMTSVNRVDGIFRREIAVSLQLVNPSITSETTNIIFDNPATDPYDNSDNIAQLKINQSTLDTRVTTPAYDVGHLYGTGGGGVASSPSACDAGSKAQGYSARAGFYGDPFTVDYVAHEIGHQFGGSHSASVLQTALFIRSVIGAEETQ